MSAPRPSVRALGCLAVLALAAVAGAPMGAGAQDRVNVDVAAGTADAGKGLVGDLGVRFAPGGVATWEAYRLDLIVGERSGYRLGAITGAIELGPPATMTGGVRLYVIAGGGLVWTDDAFGAGAMGGVGGRVRIGPVWLTAEQRFQPAFSPFLVGLSF